MIHKWISYLANTLALAAYNFSDWLVVHACNYDRKHDAGYWKEEEDLVKGLEGEEGPDGYNFSEK